MSNQETSDHKKKKILIVDDQSLMRRIIRTVLRDAGFEIIQEAEDGEKALQLMRNQVFDLVITDWHMPKMNGIILSKKMRIDERLLNTYLLMVGEEAGKDQIEAVKSASIDAYLIKPFNARTLKQKVETIFDQPVNTISSDVAEAFKAEIAPPVEETPADDAENASDESDNDNENTAESEETAEA